MYYKAEPRAIQPKKMTAKYHLETGRSEDADPIFKLYLSVSAIEGGLARTMDEISSEYVKSFVQKSLDTGIIFIAKDPETGEITGEIHAYALGPKCFEHVLGELTIAIHSEHQGIGVGNAVFTGFMRRVAG